MKALGPIGDGHGREIAVPSVFDAEGRDWAAVTNTHAILMAAGAVVAGGGGPVGIGALSAMASFLDAPVPRSAVVRSTEQLRGIFGFAESSQEETCDGCDGNGKAVIPDGECACKNCRCSDCDGAGVTFEPALVRVVEVDGVCFDANLVACALKQVEEPELRVYFVECGKGLALAFRGRDVLALVMQRIPSAGRKVDLVSLGIAVAS